jgi:Zn-dependent protease with chaperone function
VQAVTSTAASEEFERRITAELAAQNPEAAAMFKQANEARRNAAPDHALASSLYHRVYELVPSFVHALRREASEELALKHDAKALALAREAVDKAKTPENEAFLALALTQRTVKPTDKERQEALALARRVAITGANDSVLQLMAAEVALQSGDLGLLESTVRNLQRNVPQEASTHYLNAILLASQGHFSGARDALEKARGAGLSEKDYRRMVDAISASEPIWSKVAKASGVAVGVWALLFGLLFGLGAFLSAVTLRIASVAPQAGVAPETAPRMLRRTYAAVIGSAGAFYYASLPLLVFVVAATGGGVIYLFFALGRIPVKLVAIIGVLTLVSIAAVVRSLFVRSVDLDPGVRLELDEHPRLRTTLDEVAGRVGTRPVDNVYLTPGTELAVTERGGLLRQVRGTSERCLILGVGVLPGFRLGAFRAVLAHEYGHFSNRDTAGGGFAMAVRRSILKMAHHLADGGAANWWNPAWLFVNGFHRVFLRISQGASRLQEILADRWAAVCYGASAFEEGLRHVVSRAVAFDAHVSATLDEVVEAKRPLVNLYAYKPVEGPGEQEVGEKVRESLERPASAYDSHPRPVDRIAWVRQVAQQGSIASDAGLEAWTLFGDREKIERLMTDEVRGVLGGRGVEILSAPEPS